MFQRLDCVCLPTEDIDASLRFYRAMGLREAWRLERTTEHGIPWVLVGLDFPDETSSQLTLSTHPTRKGMEVEIRVADVEAACRELRKDSSIRWIAEPFAIEQGHVAVMVAPDGNTFVLIDG
jgi:catechol 2,3-dioxygenase-like lactoylglutathione lyase family enzyme